MDHSQGHTYAVTEALVLLSLRFSRAAEEWLVFLPRDNHDR